MTNMIIFISSIIKSTENFKHLIVKSICYLHLTSFLCFSSLVIRSLAILGRQLCGSPRRTSGYESAYESPCVCLESLAQGSLDLFKPQQTSSQMRRFLSFLRWIWWLDRSYFPQMSFFQSRLVRFGHLIMVYFS